MFVYGDVCTYVGMFFFLYIFRFSLCICTSAAPQRPAHGTVSSQVATHLRIDRVCHVLGRSWIRTQDYWFAVRCATIEPPVLLFSHLSCGNVCMSVGVYACVCVSVFMGTRGRKETGSAKGNRERERKPVARKEIKNAKVRARKSRSAKN